MMEYVPDDWIMFKIKFRVSTRKKVKPTGGRTCEEDLIPDSVKNMFGRPVKQYAPDDEQLIQSIKLSLWKIFDEDYNRTKVPKRVKCSGCRFFYEPAELLKHIDEHRNGKTADEFILLISELEQPWRVKPKGESKYRNKKIDPDKYRVG